MLSQLWQAVRRWRLLLAAIALFLPIVASVWWLPPRFVHDLSDSEVKAIRQVAGRTAPAEVVKAKTDRLNARNNVRNTLLQVVAGMVLIIGTTIAYSQLHTGREIAHGQLVHTI